MLHHVDDNNVDEIHTKAGTSSSGVDNNVLYAVFLAQAIPFVGFGFMDNMVMIAAGEYIERSIGATLALSTMAAAGLGNLLSDIVGVATSNKIEAYAERAGFKSPVLTAAQESARGPRLAKVLGAIIGISVGCLLGMFPLLLHDADEVAHEKEREEKKLALARANKSVG
jgi:tRNA-specific adenosine deaminase 1